MNTLFKFNRVNVLLTMILALAVDLRAEVNQGEGHSVINETAKNISLGWNYLENGKVDEAIDVFTKLIEADSSCIPAYDYRAFAFIRKGHFDKAIVDYSQIIQIAPTNSHAYLNRGNIYRLKKDNEKALIDFNNCIRLDPSNSVAYASRASVYYIKGDIDHAINDCNKSLELSSGNDQVIVMRGSYYSRAQQFGRAIADFRKAIEVNPDNADAYNNLAWLFSTCSDASTRDGKEAVKFANVACGLTHWENWEYIDTLAAAFAEIGDFKSATNCLVKAINSKNVSKPGLKLLKQHLQMYEKKLPIRVDKTTNDFWREVDLITPSSHP